MVSMDSFPVSLYPIHKSLYRNLLAYHRPRARPLSPFSTTQLKISCCRFDGQPMCATAASAVLPRRQFPSALCVWFVFLLFIHSLNISTAFSSTTDRASGGIFPSPFVLIRCSSTDLSGSPLATNFAPSIPNV